MTEISIRPATADDCGLILGFIKELAVYEKALDQVVASEEDLRQGLFGAEARAEALIAYQGDQPLGFALYFFSFSTWRGKNSLFLEDLYISPEYRGSGAGKALLKHLAQLAVSKGCGRFEWNVLDWNEPAIRFYESFGAEPQNEWVGYRLQGPALRTFAGSGD